MIQIINISKQTKLYGTSQALQHKDKKINLFHSIKVLGVICRRVTPRDKDLGLDEPYPITPQYLKFDFSAQRIPWGYGIYWKVNQKWSAKKSKI